MADLVSLLEAWCDQAAGRTLDHGVWDCCLAPAAFAIALTGQDPGAPWRGRYDSEAGARRMIREAGGLVPLMASGLEPLGWRRADRPEMGAIGVVRLSGDAPGATSRRRFGAVRLFDRWAIAAEGLLIEDARPDALWLPPLGVTA